jgi:hypothetical protein
MGYYKNLMGSHIMILIFREVNRRNNKLSIYIVSLVLKIKYAVILVFNMGEYQPQLLINVAVCLPCLTVTKSLQQLN